jgi:hypothetical protein
LTVFQGIPPFTATLNLAVILKKINSVNRIYKGSSSIIKEPPVAMPTVLFFNVATLALRICLLSFCSFDVIPATERESPFIQKWRDEPAIFRKLCEGEMPD